MDRTLDLRPAAAVLSVARRVSKTTAGRAGSGAGPPVSQKPLAAEAERWRAVENQMIEDRDVHGLDSD